MNSILAVLEEKAPSFSKGQKRIARFILSDLQKAAMLTAGALGKETEVSESTVVRFASELGYEGFPQMQKALQDALVERFSVERTIDLSQGIQKENLAKAARILTSARRIYLIVMGAERVLADHMGNCLENRFPDVHILFTDSGKLRHIGAEDAVVVFSFSANPRAMEEAAVCCRNTGAKVIGITSSERAPICNSCDVCLFANAEQRTYGLSLSKPMLLVEQLLAALGGNEDAV